MWFKFIMGGRFHTDVFWVSIVEFNMGGRFDTNAFWVSIVDLLL